LFHSNSFLGKALRFIPGGFSDFGFDKDRRRQ